MRMNQKQFFTTSLLLPLLVPAIAFFFGNTLAVVFQLSISLGLIPYALFAFGVFLWMRKKAASRILKGSWLFPIAFVPVFGAYILIHQLSREWVSASDFSFADVAALLIGYSLYVLVIGYFYVIVVNVLYRLLRKLGVFEDQIS